VIAACEDAQIVCVSTSASHGTKLRGDMVSR
jgi:hypothetical protein